jgi:hypothetical protein
VRIPPVDREPTSVAEIAPDEPTVLGVGVQQLPMRTDLPARKGDAG